jgi:hypothetical protein
MKSRILALDISTKTGWAIIDVEDGEFTIFQSGTLKKEEEFKLGTYPVNYLYWARECFGHIKVLLDTYQPDELAIEETSKGSKNGMSQKILEFIHSEFAQYFEEMDNGGKRYPRRYFLTEEWRRICGCVMNKAEKKQNAEVRKQKAKGIKVCKNKEGKRIGLVGKKHVNVRIANEVYGLDLILKDEDQADALLLAHALYIEKFKK